MRNCTECGKEMVEGFVIMDGEEYYCSKSCLDKNHTHEEYLEMHDNGDGDSYWTIFEEDDIQE